MIINVLNGPNAAEKIDVLEGIRWVRSRIYSGLRHLHQFFLFFTAFDEDTCDWTWENITGYRSKWPPWHSIDERRKNPPGIPLVAGQQSLSSAAKVCCKTLVHDCFAENGSRLCSQHLHRAIVGMAKCNERPITTFRWPTAGWFGNGGIFCEHHDEIECDGISSGGHDK